VERSGALDYYIPCKVIRNVVCLSGKNAVFDSPGLIVTQMHSINKYYAIPCQLGRDD